MKPRYCSTSARIEIALRSTFWLRASVEQQVERPFPAVEVERQPSVGGRRHRPPSSKRGQASSSTANSVPSPAAHRACAECCERPIDVAADAGHRADPSRARAASADIVAEARRRCRAISSISAPAIEHDVAARRDRTRRPLAGTSPVSAFMSMIVGHQQAVEADPLPRMISSITDRRQRRRALGVPGGVDDVRGHRPSARSPSVRNGAMSISSVGLVGASPPAAPVAVGQRAAVAGHMLDARRPRPPARSPSSIARPSAATCIGSPPSARSPIDIGARPAGARRAAAGSRR